tara:strand:- start:7725 stop:7931 length:207 start_codon:yes stop_codon:yes gene_type:complete
MTKFNESDIITIQNYWKDNKGRPQGVMKTGGIHVERTKEKTFGLQDLANHFNITEGQARRILYVKGKK